MFWVIYVSTCDVFFVFLCILITSLYSKFCFLLIQTQFTKRRFFWRWLKWWKSEGEYDFYYLLHCFIYVFIECLFSITCCFCSFYTCWNTLNLQTFLKPVHSAFAALNLQIVPCRRTNISRLLLNYYFFSLQLAQEKIQFMPSLRFMNENCYRSVLVSKCETCNRVSVGF